MQNIVKKSDLPTGCRLYIYGTGQGGLIMREAIARVEGAQFAAFVDSSRTEPLNGEPVISPQQLRAEYGSDSRVIIASQYTTEIAATLRAHGISGYLNGFPYIARELTKRNASIAGSIKALFLRNVVDPLLELGALLLIVCMALIARKRPRPLDIGLGPEPLLNNVYHKKALEAYGYSAETFVDQVYFITSKFDVVLTPPSGWLAPIRHSLRLFSHAITRYRCLYIYFNGGPLFRTRWLWRLEPFLLRLASVKVVVMPYGGDVQVMNRSPNLLFKQAMALDYPLHHTRARRIAGQVALWASEADMVISGCEWVDYMPAWHVLMLAHFSIDVDELAARAAALAPPVESRPDKPFRVLHAPNHRWQKGTRHVLRAVEELRQEGLDIELTLIEQAPNEEVLQAIARSDLIIDQLIIGWYALFALEAMTMGKPVICFLRPDLVELYVADGLIGDGEIPIINASPSTVKERLRHCIQNRESLPAIGEASRDFVRRRHSLNSVGRVFATINRDIDLYPSRPRAA